MCACVAVESGDFVFGFSTFVAVVGLVEVLVGEGVKGVDDGLFVLWVGWWPVPGAGFVVVGVVGVVVVGSGGGLDGECEELAGGVVLGGDGGGSAWGGLVGLVWGWFCGVGGVVDGLSDEWVAFHGVCPLWFVG